MIETVVIRAYAYSPSIERGRDLELCVEPGARFRVSIYSADSWQLVQAVDRVFTSGGARLQGGLDPECDRDWHWPSISIPLDLPSAVYFALLHDVDGGATAPGKHLETNAAMFVVAPGSPSAPIAYIVPIATMHAYNFTGGGCFYEYRDPHAPRSRTVTWRRPGCGIGGQSREVPDLYDAASPRQAFAHWDAKMLAWLRRNGFPVDCYTDLDLDQREILATRGAARHQLMISAGHHEYWSEPMREQVERLLDAGGNVAIFGGNTCYRKVSFDAAQAVITKENEAWPESNEASLLGVSYSHGGGCWAKRPPNGYTVNVADHWVFAEVELPPGRTIGAADRLLGYECDGVVPGVTPAGATVLAAGRLEGGWNNGEGHTATMVIFQSRCGTVFNAATTDWARILGDTAAESHAAVARITHNVVKRLSCTTTP